MDTDAAAGLGGHACLILHWEKPWTLLRIKGADPKFANHNGELDLVDEEISYKQIVKKSMNQNSSIHASMLAVQPDLFAGMEQMYSLLIGLLYFLGK